jgi:hypothetical protein
MAIWLRLVIANSMIINLISNMYYFSTLELIGYLVAEIFVKWMAEWLMSVSDD